MTELRAQVLTDLAEAEAEAEARPRREELVKARQRSRLQVLVSPVDGMVAQRAVHTVGGVAGAAKPIMTIVPVDGALVAEVKILNKDVGFVRPGQSVALKLEAFPFTRYGTVPGQIESIGSDAIQDEKQGLVYPARVLLQPKATRGETIDLSVGMAATADIRTGSRSILSYLLSPIDEVIHQAGRER